MLVFLKLDMFLGSHINEDHRQVQQSYMLLHESYRYSSGVSARDICVFINHIMILLHVDHDDDDDDVDDEDLDDYSTAL